MARIDFAFGAADRLRMACAVVQKHYSAGRRLIVYTQDQQRLAHFDRLLWGFEATAFVPHVMADHPLAADTPVILMNNLEGQPIQGGEAWLINLDLQCPPEADRYPRILEIVSNHDDDKRAARERWRQYQANGHTLHAHDVSGRNPDASA
ncbi:DNA polymerase III subunit chi [Allopusillimonas ginsengisoli]|uniref:DNA polymerase III subunit chi n=1 Tax=Allopusillimonas ginsengisoli TaxID=453575 RepID=UPI00101EC320|nr:DNA polymerase III subunit chi [Allopusillimonas ginsengisoli]TEA78505.1 DNA polymerase III subunit chi [Allopusillimonas ginsengisoli]